MEEFLHHFIYEEGLKRAGVKLLLFIIHVDERTETNVSRNHQLIHPSTDS